MVISPHASCFNVKEKLFIGHSCDLSHLLLGHFTHSSYIYVLVQHSNIMFVQSVSCPCRRVNPYRAPLRE